jgi:hypothetical protein
VDILGQLGVPLPLPRPVGINPRHLRNYARRFGGLPGAVAYHVEVHGRCTFSESEFLWNNPYFLEKQCECVGEDKSARGVGFAFGFVRYEDAIELPGVGWIPAGFGFEELYDLAYDRAYKAALIGAKVKCFPCDFIEDRVSGGEVDHYVYVGIWTPIAQ